MNGKIVELLIAKKAGEEMDNLDSVKVEISRGVVGDRYYNRIGTFSEKLAGLPDVEVTLIEKEEIDAFNMVSGLSYSGSDFRRNIVTSNVKLNDLVDKEFIVGDTKLRGIRLCEPCAHLSNSLGKEIMIHMVHKCGLRASVVSEGEISISDDIRAIT